MIVVKVFQGLGNQMFQYALAKALQVRHNVTVKLDLTWFDMNSHHRTCGLHQFNTNLEISTLEEIYNVRNGIFPNRILNRLFRMSLFFKPYFKQPFFKENLSKLDKNIKQITSRTYIEGYFTSEFFFEDVADVIRNDFTLKSQPSERNKLIIDQMMAESSVCLSVRRGDFVNNPLHDVCSIDYFQRAVALINQKLSDPVFYIFSDDNDWVKHNLKLEQRHVYITHNYPDFYEDLRLMQSCRHHIIPNSTFSWWAAWLCRHPDKIVIGPEIWLNTTEIDYSYFLPKTWLRIKNSL
jgi:hypothetical protein